MALRALLSVSDRTGLHVFARGLRDLGWELIATDGTRAALAAEGINARSIEDVTGTPSLLGGRVKTLHPKIHAALLARRDDPSHLDELKQAGIEPIDLVAVNLYPFGESAADARGGGVLAHRRIRRDDRVEVRGRGRRDLPRRADALAAEDPRPPVRREPPPAGRLLWRPWRERRDDLGSAAPRKGDELQQHAGHQRRLARRVGLHAADGRDRQASEPVRHRLR